MFKTKKYTDIKSVNKNTSIFASWDVNLTEEELKKNLMNLITGYRLQEIYEYKDNSVVITNLKTKPYFSKSKPKLKIKWDDDCENLLSEYLTDADYWFKKYKPKKVNTKFVKHQLYNCGGYSVHYDFIFTTNNEEEVKIWLRTRQEIKEREEREREEIKFSRKFWKYHEHMNNYVWFEGKPHVLISMPWRFEGAQLRIKKNRDTDEFIQTNIREIKPYYTAHERLINLGYKHINKDGMNLYKIEKQKIEIDINSNVYKVNFEIDIKTARILIQYLKELENKIIHSNII